MAGAIIAFDQTRPGIQPLPGPRRRRRPPRPPGPPIVSYGSPGIARDDLWLNRAVICRSTEPDNISFLWEFLDVPPGSAAQLVDATTATASFTPDLPGSYRVQLTTNGGGPGNVQVLIAAVMIDSGHLLNRGWRVPAFGEVGPEANFEGQLRGWAAVWERIFADLLDVTGASLAPLEFSLVSSLQKAAPGDAQLIGAKVVDFEARFPPTIGALTRNVQFEALIASESVDATTTLQLIDPAGPTVLATFTNNTLAGSSYISDDILADVALPTRLDVKLQTSGGVGSARCYNAVLIITYE